MSVAVIYGTVEGQTGKIARFAEQTVHECGHGVASFDTAKCSEDIDLEKYNMIVLAASVHERRHPAAFEAFLTANKKTLNQKRTLLLSVSLSAAFDEGIDDAHDYLDELKMRTGFQPTLEKLVAGAVRSKSYGYYEKQVLRFVVLKDRGYDFKAKEHEFTDWKSLKTDVAGFVDEGHIT